MRTPARRASIVALFLAAVSGLAAAQPQARRPAPPAAAAPGSTRPEHEPANSESARLRREQAERAEIRRLLDWNTLDDDAQEAFWDEAVGPDQLDNGRRFAEVRPSVRRDRGFGPRDDPFGDRGVPLVSLSWAYTPPAAANTAETYAFDMDLNVMGNVSFTGALVSPNGNTRVKSTELRGVADSTEGYTKNWDQVYNIAATPAGYLEGKACASDLSGRLFWGGLRGNGQYHLAKLDGADSGARLVDADFTASATATNATVYNLIVDPEGILYAAGTFVENGVHRGFVARHEPDATLSRTWIQTYSHQAGTRIRLMCDRAGFVYFMNTTGSGAASVRRLSPYDGMPEWQWTGPAGSIGQALDLDFAGTPHVAAYTGAATNDWQTSKLDASDGHAIWQKTVTNGVPVDLKVDPKGNVFVLGSKGSATARLVKYDAAGDLPPGFVQPSYGTTGAPGKIALDWIGNPYVCIMFGVSHQSTDTRKFDPDLGAVPGQGDDGEVWHYYLSPTFSGSETNGAVDVVELLVDSSGSVYVCGSRDARSASNDAHLSNEFFFIKYEQPFTSIPQVARSNPDLRIENHSVWLPEEEDPASGPPLLNSSFRVFNIDVDSLIDDQAVTDLLTMECNYVAGTVKGQVELDLSSSVNIGVDFVTTANSGSYDATVKGELAIAVPGEAELNAGQPFAVVVDFEPDANGMEMIANSAPRLSASFVSNVTGTADMAMRAWNKNARPDYPPPFWDYQLPLPGLSTLDDRTLLSVFGANPPAAGTWLEYELYGVSGRFTMPQLKARGVFEAAEAAGSSGSNTGDDDTLRMTSSLSEEFFSAGISITDLITEAATGLPLSYSWSLPAGDEDNTVSLGIGLLQAHLDRDIKAEQTLTLDMKPYVRLEFPGASPAISPITRKLVKRVDSAGSYSYQPETAIQVTLPASGELEIRPYFGVSGRMRNQSGLRFGASAGFDPLSLSAEFTALGVNIFTLDECYGCTTIPIVNAPFTIYDYTSPWFAFTGGSEGDDEIELPSIQVKGDANTTPQLIGSSRASGRMIIYDQRSSSQSQLNAVAGSTEPMVLYGRKFFSNANNRAWISHHGRTEQLSVVRLNDQSLLVQVPQRFYLLPGIARIWTVNSNGRSQTIDFPIEYPFPNFLGIQGLDGAGDPTIWAGDPRWKTSPVVAIDGGTPGGNDSFIARRDYYSNLAAALWNPGLFDPLDPNRNLAGHEYFPAFKGWELPGRPKSPPGFPTLVFDGVALNRHRPFINDGYFRSNLQSDLYATPHVATLQLNNPGPGGGAGRVLTLAIPAPAPVVSGLEPSSWTPGTLASGTTLRVVVNGPDSAPYLPGYEVVKAGNFTPESIVSVNGTAVATTYISSGRLAAEVPAALLNTAGPRFFTVATPGNGITYFEQLRTGGGVLLPGGQVDSGGSSLAATFDVLWPAPEISGLSQPELHVGQPPNTPFDRNGVPSDGRNFGMTGANFAPGCQVYWNGRLMPDAVRDSAGAIRLTVTAADLPAAGPVRIWVRNPAPNLRSSRPVILDILP